MTECIENTAQISGQDTICIAFSKMVGSPISLAYRLKAQSPNLKWTKLKRELSMQYSAIPCDSHAIQAFSHLKQCPEMSSLICICTRQVSFCQKFIILPICLEFQWKA